MLLKTCEAYYFLLNWHFWDNCYFLKNTYTPPSDSYQKGIVDLSGYSEYVSDHFLIPWCYLNYKANFFYQKYNIKVLFLVCLLKMKICLILSYMTQYVPTLQYTRHQHRHQPPATGGNKWNICFLYRIENSFEDQNRWFQSFRCQRAVRFTIVNEEREPLTHHYTNFRIRRTFGLNLKRIGIEIT